MRQQPQLQSAIHCWAASTASRALGRKVQRVTLREYGPSNKLPSLLAKAARRISDCRSHHENMLRIIFHVPSSRGLPNSACLHLDHLDAACPVGTTPRRHLQERNISSLSCNCACPVRAGPLLWTGPLTAPVSQIDHIKAELFSPSRMRFTLRQQCCACLVLTHPGQSPTTLTTHQHVAQPRTRVRAGTHQLPQCCPMSALHRAHSPCFVPQTTTRHKNLTRTQPHATS